MTEPPAAALLQSRDHVAWLLGLAAALAAYALWHALTLPAPVYLPEVERWAWSPPEGLIGMRYYGWLLVGLVAFGLGNGLGRVGPVARRLAEGRGARWLCAGVVLEVLAALGYLAVSELARWGG